ncbi:hypothetical protein PBY51_000621 [Eleginops maclovinus]|uniref:Uncharacterized protein n=1 Tax=Eleginops maclovinus TaxID=56733 RepID=A0AAN7XHU8_ELEMC|nr:hypothetical protein PBY51_000621 [Eleginops maclovinus]
MIQSTGLLSRNTTQSTLTTVK